MGRPSDNETRSGEASDARRADEGSSAIIAEEPKDTSAHAHASLKPQPNRRQTARRQNTEFVRAENEDDDGYDPYSDRPAASPLFERDPWD